MTSPLIYTFHPEITSEDFPFYDHWDAEDLYSDKKTTWQEITLWQQENIRLAALLKIAPFFIEPALKSPKGLCFEFRGDRDPDYWKECKNCPAAQNLKKPCHTEELNKKMLDSETSEELAKYHGQWCKKINLPNVMWKSEWDKKPSFTEEEIQFYFEKYPILKKVKDFDRE